MGSADFSHGADEGGFVVERFGTLESDTVLFGLLLKLNVDFVERLDVVTGEGDGDDDGVLVTLLGPAFDGVARLRSEPGSGTDLGLPCDSVGVAPLQSGHDGSDGSGNLGGVWITTTGDDLHGKRVGTEHDGNLVALLLWVCVEYSLNAVGESLDEQRVGRPSVNKRPRDLTFWRSTLLAPLNLTVELVEVATSGTAAVLRVLGEADSASNTVLSHLVECLFGKRSCVSESDIDLVWRCLRVKLVKQLRHCLTLCAGPTQDRRAAANLFVLVDDLGRPSTCDEGCKTRLERKLNELSIVKETREEVTNLLGGGCGGSTHIHEEDTGGWLGRVLGDRSKSSVQGGSTGELDG